MAYWYYIHDGQQIGPVPESSVQQAIQEGVISAETLMWSEGMSDWQPYARVSAYLGGQAPTDPNRTTCPNCHASVAPDDLAQIEDTYVCPFCKEAYVQRIKEGVHPSGAHRRYAGFWIRFCAAFLDGIIVRIIQMPIAFLLGIVIAQTEAAGPLIFVANYVLSISIAIGYYVLFWGHPRYQATPGKMACRLRLISMEGPRVTYLRALGRYFAYMLSGMLLCIGFLMCIWDDQKRCLHDHICNTRVVRL